MDNCRQLEIMSGVVPFIWLQLARSIGHNFPVLHKNTTKTLQRSITENLVRLGLIRRSKYRSCDEFLLQSIEGHVTLRSPRVFDILLEEVGKRLSNLREVLHKSSAIA